MATRNSKKFLLLLVIALFGLAACDDDIASYPKDGEILPTSQNQTIYHNELSSIYEKIRDGALASDVLDKLLYEYANTIFGIYSPSSPIYSTNVDNGLTVKEVAESGDNNAKVSFVLSHKAYWPGAVIPENPTDDEKATAVAKLDAIAKSVEGRIAKALYDKISGGAYSEHNIFSERKFLASLYYDGQKVADYRTAPVYEGIIDPEIEPEEVFESGILNKDNYYSNENTYALENNIESIYRQLLIEQYITDESYSTLGRSYARKVNVLSLSVDSDNKADIPALVKYVVNDIIASKDGEDKLVVAADDRHGEEAVKGLYSTISNVLKGLPAYFDSNDVEYDPLAKKIVDKLFTDYGLFGNTANLVANPDDNYLTSTAYGSMMKDYLKIRDNLVETDSSIESTFTGAGKYTIAKGKEYKETEISLKKYTTTGWQLKNGGLTSLPDTIRNRLFNLSVASALDVKEGGLLDRTSQAWVDAGGYSHEIETNKYVAKVNGAYFLKAEKKQSEDSNEDLYFYDSSSKTYYFVQIVEAVNPSKLDSQGSTRYAELYKDDSGNNNDILQERIAREVCEKVAEISSYSGLAKDHWLEKMALEYHDTTIYNYFKTNYPDLFE